MYVHILKHRIRYVSFFIVAILISLVAYTLYKAGADEVNTPTFVRDITWPLAPGDHYATFTPSKFTLDNSGNMYVIDASNSDAQIQKFGPDGEYLFNFGLVYNPDPTVIYSTTTTLAIDSQGNSYRSGQSGFEKYDSSGNFLQRIATVGNGVGQMLYSANQVIFDASNNIYVLAGYNIYKFDSTGNFVWGGGGYGTGDGQLVNAKEIAVDSNGNVYANQLAGGGVVGGRLTKFDANGTYISKMSLPYGGGVAVNGNGDIYVSDGQTNEIMKFDQNFNLLSSFGGYGTTTGKFSSPMGIMIDASDNIYVADVNNHRIQKFDTNGNFLLTFGTKGYGNGQMINAGQVFMGNNGDLYVLGYGDLQRFDASGNYIEKYSPFKKLVPQVIATDSLGNVYVSYQGDTIYKYSSAGEFLSKAIPLENFGNMAYGNQYSSRLSVIDFSIDSGGNIYPYIGTYELFGKFNSSGELIGTYLTNYDFTDSGRTSVMAFTADVNGAMYIVNSNYDHSTTTVSIKKYDSAGNFIMKFGNYGTGDGDISDNASMLRVDGSGNIYLFEGNGTNRVQKFDSNGSFIKKYSLTSSLQSFAIDSSFNVYASFAYYKAIKKYGSDGTLISSWVPSGTVDTAYFSPYKLAVATSGVMYAVDDANGTILMFSSDGEYISRFGSYSGENAFSWPFNIALDSMGNVYVTDCENGVKKFTATGTFVGTFGTGYTPDCTSGIAFDSQGNVYVADDLGYIEKFDATGNHLGQVGGGTGTGDGQFSWVEDIYIDSSDNLYVADNNNSRIQKFDVTGNFVMKFGTSGSDNGQFSYVSGITTDAAGNIHTTDADNGYQKFDSSGNFLFKVTEANGIDFNGTGDVILDSFGNLQISDYSHKRISTFSFPPLIVSDVAATTSLSSAIVVFTTDEIGSTQIEYGLTNEYGSLTVATDTSPRVTSHAYTLTGLPSCSSFNYRVRSKSITYSETISPNYTFMTSGCTGSASTTAVIAETASSTATSTVVLSTISLSVPPDFSTTTETVTVFQVAQLEPVSFFASSSVPTGKLSASTDVFHLTALTDATTTISSFTAPISITLSYSDISGIRESSLTIYRYDGSSWHALTNCVRNPSARTVTCETSNFSDFTLFGIPNSSTITLGASGYANAPDGHLTSTPPVPTTSPTYTPPVAATTTPTTTPVVVVPVKTITPPPTPVKTVPKGVATTTKATAKATTTSTPKTVTVSTSTLLRPIYQKKNFFEFLVEVIKGWWR